MSIKAMNWAWSIPLPPTLHIVLLALSDIANDIGFSFPSVGTLARLCVISERTVQRVLCKLVAGNYMSVEQRFRADGARTSNGYRLNLSMTVPPRNCHRPSDVNDTGSVTETPAAFMTGPSLCLGTCSRCVRCFAGCVSRMRRGLHLRLTQHRSPSWKWLTTQ